MKKYLPLIKVMTLANIMFFCMVSFFVYFNVKTPGLHSISEKKMVWTVENLVELYFFVSLLTTIFMVVTAMKSTKSLSSLNSRFLKKSKFKVLNKETLISYLVQEYLNEQNFYYKILEKFGGNFQPSKIKVLVSNNEIEFQLDRKSLFNFQMDQKYCEEVNKFRCNCAEAIGEEIV